MPGDGLPDRGSAAKAEFENGILPVEIPKAEEVKPKAIKVKAR